MLSVNNLRLQVGASEIVKGVSFDVQDGEILCLLGPSGCGKTSTLRLIAGLERPTDGMIKLDGKTISDRRDVVPPHKRDVGFLFQDFALFPHLTVSENIAYGLSAYSKSAVKMRVDELLGQIRLRAHADKYPHMLSGGEQQRVALARASAPRPNILLLDEPFSGLDTALREQLRDETLQILKDRGVTTILVTHDPEEALTSADRIVLMNDGEVVQTGTPKELFANPASIFCAEFFGKINRLPGTVTGDAVETDLGAFRNTDFSEGAEVEVLLRPEALKISSAPASASASELLVCGVRYAGSSSLVRLGIGSDPEPHTHIELRHPGPVSYELGDKLWVEVDPAKAFVFKR